MEFFSSKSTKENVLALSVLLKFQYLGLKAKPINQAFAAWRNTSLAGQTIFVGGSLACETSGILQVILRPYLFDLLFHWHFSTKSWVGRSA